MSDNPLPGLLAGCAVVSGGTYWVFGLKAALIVAAVYVAGVVMLLLQHDARTRR